MTGVTAHQLSLLHHTLGLREDRRTPTRNHFLAGRGHHDKKDLEALEATGLVERGHTPLFCEAGDVVFRCTEAGIAYALNFLPPEPKLTRYDEYLRSDSSESFGEFLAGSRLPKFEQKGALMDRGSRPLYRMYREIWFGYGDRWRDVQGEWAPTKKAAKASYKDALMRRRAQSAKQEAA